MATVKPLTQKQENFCQSYIETGNAAEAYRRAYVVKKMNAQAVAVEACRLLDNPNIALRVEQLRKKVAERNEITVDDLIKELEEARIMASTGEKPQTASMVAATMGKAKLLGFDKVIMAGDPDNPLKMEQSIKVEFVNP